VASVGSGRLAVHERDRRRLARLTPGTACDEGVHVGLPPQVPAERLHDRDHAQPEVVPGRRRRGDQLRGSLVRRLAEPTKQRAVMKPLRPGSSVLPTSLLWSG